MCKSSPFGMLWHLSLNISNCAGSIVLKVRITFSTTNSIARIGCPSGYTHVTLAD